MLLNTAAVSVRTGDRSIARHALCTHKTELPTDFVNTLKGIVDTYLAKHTGKNYEVTRDTIG